MSDWPRPPRHVPRRVALATWNAFGRSVGILLAVALLGAIVYWASDDFRSPRIDAVLDAADGCEVARGEVLAVARDHKKNGAPAEQATYTFRFADRGGQSIEASSSGALALAVGDRHGVEYVVAAPTQARLVGTVYSRVSLLLPWFPGFVLLPLVLATGLWLARAYRTWVIVRHGRAADAVLLECTVRRPPMRRGRSYCRLRYRFRGSDGSDHEAWQHDRPDSALAQLCRAATVGAPLAGAFVAFAEIAPKRCRLVAVADVPEAAA